MKTPAAKIDNTEWRAELRLFSGRRNPEWDLNAECKAAILEKIKASQGKQVPMPHLKMPQSGYRGIRVSTGEKGRHIDLFRGSLVESGAGCLSNDADDVARKIYGCMSDDQLKVVDGASFDEIHAAPDGLTPIEGIKSVPIGRVCASAPEYAGDTGKFMKYRAQNNCYNYGIDRYVRNREDAAMPGGLDEVSTPEKFIEAFESDHLTLVGTTTLEDACPPAGSHYIAVVLRKGEAGTKGDFHVLRLDRNGRWSHKDNDDPVTALDGQGAPIVDLKTALFEWPSRILGFFRVPHYLEVIKGRVKK